MAWFRRWLWVMFAFTGRINRREYWLMGWPSIVALAAAVVGLVMVSAELEPESEGPLILAFFVLVAAIYWVFFAICTKRVRDLGSSGWMVLLILIPFIGWIFPIWWGIERAPEEESEQGGTL